MTVYLRQGPKPGLVFIQARLEGEGRLGDISRMIGPGESFEGYSAEELLAMGEGRQELGPKSEGEGPTPEK